MSNKIIDGSNLKFALQENNKKIKQYIDENNHFDEIQKYQKYINTELDYCCLHLGNTDIVTLTQNYVMPFVNDNTNMKTNENNYSVYLKAGRNYKITSDIYVSNAGFGVFDIYDLTNDIVLQQFVKSTNSNTSGIASTVGEVIYTPENDCEVQIKVAKVKETIKIESLKTRSYFIIQEIGRQVIIDPIEHVNTNNGIEDTPVGHIISVIGNSNVKHYLLCDGTEYNISDYPYLAQYIENSFEIINYFGGDGENTFAVPDINHDGKTEILMSYASTKNKDEEVIWTATKDCTLTYKLSTGNGYNAALYIDGIKTDYSPGSTPNSSKSGVVELKKGQTIKVEMGDAVTTLEITAKTEERFYYIKYEPTYFMTTQNTNYVQRNLYSLEEKIIGSWINGKPLYQKTIKSITPEVTTEGTYANTIVDIKNLNIDDGFIQCSYLKTISSNNSQHYCLPYITNNGGICKCFITKESISINTNVKSFSQAMVYITLQYTKTIDAENSFTDDMLDYIQSGNGNCNCEPEEELTEEQIQDLITQAVTEINE